MSDTTPTLNGLTDEEVLDQFVKRFQCDGAILIYLDSKTEYGFARWANPEGRQWVNELFTAAKNNVSMRNSVQEICNYEDSQLVSV